MSAAHGVPPRGAPQGATDTLTLKVDGKNLTGWQRVQVTRSMDSVPASFDIQVTEKYPLAPDIDVKPGAPCTVSIGGDLVLTGYVDRYTASVSAGDHTVRIAGRSMSEDLVDCSALFDTASGQPGMQQLNGTALAIARGLAKPYGVTINSLNGDGATIPQFNINLGETAWEIIDRVTRYSKLVAYDLPDGSMVMAQAGSEKMASGFALGSNIEHADVSYSMDERFQQYEAHFLSTMAFGTDAGVNSPTIGQIVRDDGVPRFRKRYIVSEQTILGRPIAYDRAVWERNRRYGRSQVFSVVCDSWRDAAGALWAPNHLAPIQAKALKLPAPNDDVWVIASVSYLRDENGQHAALTLMPKQAFDPEPLSLQNIPPMIGDTQGNNPTKPDTFNPPAQTAAT
jgi:prophage tail gpP-like protein